MIAWNFQFIDQEEGAKLSREYLASFYEARDRARKLARTNRGRVYYWEDDGKRFYANENDC